MSYTLTESWDIIRETQRILDKKAKRQSSVMVTGKVSSVMATATARGTTPPAPEPEFEDMVLERMVELGERKTVGGQEDMIIDVAIEMAKGSG